MNATPTPARDPNALAAVEAAERRALVMLASATALPDIRASVERLRGLLAQHFDATEAPDGLYEELRMIEPIVAAKVDRLVDEHAELREQLGELRSLIDEAAVAMGRLNAAKEAFIAHVKDCEAKEREVVSDAYYVDLGGGD